MDKKKLSRTKSYTSIYDTYNSPKKYSTKLKSIENYLLQIGNLPLKTSEKYERKTHKNKADKNIVDSMSTIFYDLDTIAKRKSFNCISDITLTNKKVLNTKYQRPSVKADLKTNCKVYPARKYFNESTTYIDKPIPLYSHDIRKIFPHDSEISSNFNVSYLKNCSSHLQKHKKDKKTKDQKWKHMKYHIGSCSPVIEKRRKKNKDHAHIPKKKSHPECFYCNKRSTAKIHRNMQVAKDQVSDVSLLPQEHKITKLKVFNHDSTETPEEKSDTLTDKEKFVTDDSFNSKYLTKNIIRRIRKHCQITCPNCNKKVLVTTAEDDKKSDSKNTSTRYNSIELSKTLNYRYLPYNVVNDNINTRGCGHKPQCDLIPICQMLHSVQSPATSKGARNSSLRSPHVLRVTKACRHHPPCTMVPSCQRLKVLKNNCQYFPECPHRPRCMNLPLCAPISKTNYDQFTVTVNDTDNAECRMGQYDYIPANEQSTGSNVIYEPCDYVYPTAPTFFMQPKIPAKSFSPYELIKPMTTTSPKLNQSCQYDCVITDDNTQNNLKKDKSEGVIYIRDVGCQFRNKFQKEIKKCYDSRDSKTSTGDNESSQITNDSLQSDEKVASLSPEVEVGSTDLSSIDETSHSTSTGQKNELNHRREMSSGFVPQATTAQFIAYSTRTEPILATRLLENKRAADTPFCETYASPARVMSRRSFLKQKYKKMFSVRRRRKSKVNQTGCCPIRKLTHQHVIK